MGCKGAGGSCAVRRRRGSPMQPLRMSRRVMNLAHMVTRMRAGMGAPASSGATDPGPGARSTRQVSALAAALAARGVVKGDRILVHSKNCDEMFWSMFAAFRLGAVWVPTNFRLMPDEVAYLAAASGAKAFLCHGDFPDHAAAAAKPGARSSSGGSAAGRVWRDARWRKRSRRMRTPGSRTPPSSMTIPAGSSSPRAPPAAPRRRC